MNASALTRIVAISPHQDDVALSTTQFLSMMSKVSGIRRLDLISCFTESQYAPFAAESFTNSIPQIRRQEDLAYLERLGFESTSLSCLGQLDAPLRPEWKAGADVHDPRHYLPTDAAEIDRHARGLASLLASKRDDEALFLVPLGIRHKDHIIANDAALRALSRLPLLLYEDVPYVFRASEAEVQGRVAAACAMLGEALWPVKVPDVLVKEQWVGCISAYQSQFSMNDVEEMADAFRAHGGERLWANRTVLPMLRAAGCDAAA